MLLKSIKRPLSLAGWDSGQNGLAGRLECRLLLEEGWVCLNENLGRYICCYETVHKEVRFGLTNRQRVESKAMLLLESRNLQVLQNRVSQAILWRMSSHLHKIKLYCCLDISCSACKRACVAEFKAQSNQQILMNVLHRKK